MGIPGYSELIILSQIHDDNKSTDSNFSSYFF